MDIRQQMIEYMVADLVEMLTEERGVEYDAAMYTVYMPEVYEKVADVETGLYRESPAYVFGLLQDGLECGDTVQRGTN